MEFERFCISRYKGINHISLPLQRQACGAVYTLIGLNESGKTTILEALRWWYSSEGIDAHDLIPRRAQMNFNGTVEVLARLRLSSDDKAAIAEYSERELGFRLCVSALSDTMVIERVAQYEASERVRERRQYSLRLVGRTKRGKKIRELHPTDTMAQAIGEFTAAELVPPVVYYPNLLFEFPDRIYLEAARSGVGRPYEAQYREALQDVLTALDRDLTIAEHLVRRHEAGSLGASRSIGQVLEAAAAKLTSEFREAWGAILGAQVPTLEIALGTAVVDDEDGRPYVQFKVREAASIYDIRERSLGFRWFLGFVLFTHFRAYRDQPLPTLFLLDEPASNLHPAAQTLLMHGLANLPRRPTVMYATHSHYMVEPKWLGSAYVVKNAGQGVAPGSGVDAFQMDYTAYQTDITATPYYQFVAAYPDQTDVYRPALDALAYQPGPLERIPEVVIVEGKTDYHLVTNFLKGVEVPGADDLRAYPVVGRMKTESVVAQYVAWGREFVVLLDGDAGGLATAETLETEFGRVVAERTLTLADIDPGWDGRVMEDLFDPRDRTKIAQRLFAGIATEPSKSKFGVALEHVCVGGEYPAIQIMTRQRFEKLVEALRDKAKWLS